MTARTCSTCGHSLRAQGGRWVHDAARGHLLDNHHRAILGEYHGEPVALPDPPPAVRVPRKPRRTIVPLPEPVRWGRQQPIERRPFNAEMTRRHGCEVAAGIPLLGEL